MWVTDLQCIGEGGYVFSSRVLVVIAGPEMEVTRGVVVASVLRWGGGGGDGFGLVGGGCSVCVSNTKLAGVGVWLLLEEGLTVV
jgi:hypothetical protein